MFTLIGTSNIVLPSAKKNFPEEFKTRSRLYYYSTLFNSVELNSTFYKVPKITIFQKWRDDVTEDFKFSIKLWRDITHTKNLAYAIDDLIMFLTVSQGLGVRKGCLLIQFPASVTVAYGDHVEKLLDEIIENDETPRWRLCIEFRHPSWYTEDVYQMLLKRNASPVFHDMPASCTPLTSISLWPTIYLRFHGPSGDYRGNYTDVTLTHYASLINDIHKQRKEVYVYFNNTIGNAFDNALSLQALTN
jgi:uncharacterized protein YecE (DUF72 family)